MMKGDGEYIRQLALHLTRLIAHARERGLRLSRRSCAEARGGVKADGKYVTRTWRLRLLVRRRSRDAEVAASSGVAALAKLVGGS